MNRDKAIRLADAPGLPAAHSSFMTIPGADHWHLRRWAEEQSILSECSRILKQR